MNDTERKHEIRRQRAMERLGSNSPKCAICGENEPHCLERHHVAGQAFADDTVILCRNCHRKTSDTQKDHPERSKRRPDPLERIGHFLLGIADLFELLIGKLREFGGALIAQAQATATRART